ncbi:MAG: NADH-quinone oxidoreductase subunit M [Deltaproteobacteria bacterium]|nr:NADH-quinone oxidoreductase subunit M [Deltaproteobacteria bacterium]
MSLVTEHLLTLIVFLPTVFAILLLPFSDQDESGRKGLKIAALVSSLAVFALSLLLYTGFDSAAPGFQFNERHGWIPAFGITYWIGIDGISLFLILLTTFLTPIVILSSWNAIERKLKAYLALLLVLETGMIGAFVALDVFLFYIFWEAMLVPMYFLIGVWGGKERIYASMKFFLFTLVGSLLMLVAIFYLLAAHKEQFGGYSAAITDLYKLKIAFDGFLSPQTLLFLAFAASFAIKVPMFPLHTWLPDAHVQAPTAGSVILAGVLLKFGGYGFIRFAFPVFPAAVQYVAPAFMALGAIAIVYGAWVSMVQPDIKKLVAYSSVSHMGFVILGLFSLNTYAVTGSIYQMLSHGVSTGGLFLIVGMIYERRHTREIADFGGISRAMPLFATVFMIVTLSSVALPGTNGFIGEFLILLGSFQVSRLWTVIAGTGVIFGAVYMLWMFQRVMFGPLANEENKALPDLSLRELAVMAPIVAAVFVMGIFPNLFLAKMEVSVRQFLTQIKV